MVLLLRGVGVPMASQFQSPGNINIGALRRVLITVAVLVATLFVGCSSTTRVDAGHVGIRVRLAGSESHLCCGSAGTYSVLQPELANELRDRKLSHLEPLQPHTIVSANIGCIQHLQTGTAVAVKHWVEVLDEALGD